MMARNRARAPVRSPERPKQSSVPVASRRGSGLGRKAISVITAAQVAQALGVVTSSRRAGDSRRSRSRCSSSARSSSRLELGLLRRSFVPPAALRARRPVVSRTSAIEHFGREIIGSGTESAAPADLAPSPASSYDGRHGGPEPRLDGASRA
jgi:hypothetical protein